MQVETGKLLKVCTLFPFAPVFCRIFPGFVVKMTTPQSRLSALGGYLMGILLNCRLLFCGESTIAFSDMSKAIIIFHRFYNPVHTRFRREPQPESCRKFRSVCHLCSGLPDGASSFRLFIYFINKTFSFIGFTDLLTLSECGILVNG